jgi:SlyX protein
MEQRLIELETRIAFQEETLQALNAVIVRQQQDMEYLQREIAALRAQVHALAPALVASRGEETPPPHY